jgi:predicted glycoside hydrolase/deacetylase ChbG (UPF0249 family)
MAKYLIVTADDLGLTKSINEGILKACKEGIVTAVSVIPTGEGIEDALAAIKDLPFKDIGAHLSLSETKPILSSSRFYKNHNKFFFSLLLGRINLNDVYAELKAQIEILKKAGCSITHINSHEHVHMIPQVLNIFVRLAKEYGISVIRFPRGDRTPKGMSLKENYRSFILNYFTGSIEDNLKKTDLIYTDYFMGLLDAGQLNIDKVKNILTGLKEGVTEIVTHPGFLSPEVLDHYKWHMGCETELFALTDKRIKNFIKENSIKLISYEEFLTLRK